MASKSIRSPNITSKLSTICQNSGKHTQLQLLPRKQPFSTSSLLRATTTSSSQITPPQSASASTSPQTASSQTLNVDSIPLSWNDFLKLRKQRRRYNLVGSVASSLTTTFVGLNVLGNQEIEMSQMIWGLDPIMVLGMGMIGCSAAGWLIGPAFGSMAFKFANRKHLPEIALKEKEFFTHIKKNRVDPSFQSFSNPVPDYYGEKIGSIQQYRQWLKDQRAYNRKRAKFL